MSCRIAYRDVLSPRRHAIVRTPYLRKHYSVKATSVFEHRDWIESREEPSTYPGTTRSRFKVSTYNILNQHYMWPSVYKYVPEKYKSWDYRLELLDANFRELDADIMCFQEMEYDVYQKHWKDSPVFADYESVFKIKDPPGYWEKPADQMDGVALFVRKSKFRIVSSLPFKYSTFAESHPELYKHTESFRERVVPRNTVGIVAALEHLDTKEIVFSATTHLYWSPKFLDVNLYHALMLADVIKQEITKVTGLKGNDLDEALIQRRIPIIVSGDFNSKNDSMTHDLYAHGWYDLKQNKDFPDVDYGFDKKVISSNLLPLKSAYRKLYEEGHFPTSTYTDKQYQIIDYIWYNDYRMNLIRSLGQLRPDYTKSHTPMPNRDFPSDHIPLISEFELIT